MTDYRTMALKANCTPEHAACIDSLAIACEALWNIAQFAVHVGTAPTAESYDDTESAYSNGEDVALWEEGMKALKALSDMGDAKAAEIFAANQELENVRDREDEDEGESADG